MEELKEKILKILEKKKLIEARELVKELKIEEEKIGEVLLDLEDEDKIELIEFFPKDKGFKDYILTPDYSAWYFLILIGVFLTVLVTLILPSNIVTATIRMGVGILFIIFFPGYAVVETIFSKRSEISLIERFALSIGLSIAIAPILGLILNYTFGIRLFYIITTLSAFTLFFSTLALIRKYRLAKNSLMGSE